MRYRRFGRTGINISEIVFGGGWVGGILIHQDDDTKRAAIRMAIDAGINWIDTAASYGDGQSETAIGWLMKELPADQRPHISTKVGVDTNSSESWSSQIERSLHASLKRLDMDRVELFQLHNMIGAETNGRVMAASEILKTGGVADAFDRLRDQGLFSHQGITALGNVASLNEVLASQRFETAQVYYNLVNPSAGQSQGDRVIGHDFRELLATCRANDVGVMNIRIFAAGVIVSDERHGREVPVTDETDLDVQARRARRVFETIGEGHGTRAQTAVRFGLANRDVSCVVLGLADLAHLREAIDGAAMGPLPEEAMAQLRALYAGGLDG